MNTGQENVPTRTSGAVRPSRRRLLLAGRIAILLALLIFPGCAVYNCAARHSLAKETEQTPRDPVTGVVLGTEAVTLYPETPAAGKAPVIRQIMDTTRQASRTGLGLFNATAEAVRATEAVTVPRDPVTGIIASCESLDIDAAPGSFAGDRPTTAVLLIHGFLGSRKDLADLGERLAAQGFFVRIPRLPGHGTTPEDFARQKPESLLAGVLEEYDILREHFGAVYVAGFSMGGALATLLAAHVPVDRLVLIAPYYGVAHMWYYLLAAETWHTLMGRFVPWAIKSDAFIKLSRAEARKELFSYRAIPKTGVDTLIRLGEAAREPATLAAIACPVLMVISRGDEASSPARARDAFERIASPDKTALWLHQRNNHHILWDHDREEALAAIVGFLARG